MKPVLKTFVLLLAILAMCPTAVLPHQCSHGDFMKDVTLVKGMEHERENLNPRGRRLLDWQPLRVKVDYTLIQNMPENMRQYLQYVVIPASIDRIQKLYNVIQYTTPVKYTSSTCGGIAVPAELKAGVEDTDLYLITTWVNLSSNYFVARAGPCAVDSTTGRPYVGIVQFNYAYMGATEAGYSVMLGAVLHEIHHVLFFSSSLFSAWINPSTNAKTNPLSYVTIDGISTAVLTDSTLVQAARDHFGCQTMTYVRLENQGTSGNVGNHWERKIFGNEFMIAQTSNRMPISTLTLAAAEASGWYMPNYNLAEPLYWGKNKGCNFINSPCLSGSPPTPVSSEFCGVAKAIGCDLEQSVVSVCGTTTSTVTNANWNYFGDGKTTSSDTFSDGCPIPNTYRTCAAGGQTGYMVPEYFGSDSACFTTSIVYTYLSSYGYGYVGECFQFQCSLSGSTYTLSIWVKSQLMTCTTAGQVIATTDSALVGDLICPDPQTFCPMKMNTCSQACGGYGTCVNNACVCPSGRASPDCLRSTIVQNDPACACSFPAVNSIDGNCICPNYVCSDTPTVQQCSACIPYCTACTNVTICTACASGYYVTSTGGCAACGSNCATCTSASTCTACVSGYTLTSGSCVGNCPANCASCSSSTVCTTCNEGYYRDASNQCSICSSNCKQCTGASTCTSCFSGYTLSSGTCNIICSSNCQSCTTPYLCTTCNSGYYKDSSNLCQPCAAGCSACSSATACTTCSSGYTLANGVCTVTCVSNCASCTTPNTCNVCNSGYFKSSSTSCQACPSNCAACSSSTACTTCNTGYTVSSSTKLCVIACSSNCDSCSLANTCSTCKSGYFVNSSSLCQACPSSCATCTSSTTCTSCVSGYQLSSAQCTPTCGPNCNACTTPGTCSTCKSGYYLSSSQCTACPTGCSACTSSTVCTACSGGYILSGSTCVAGCSDPYCTSCPSGTCTICTTGYYLSSGSCAKCATQCTSCSTTSTNCASCTSGYYLSGSTCTACPTGCLTCNSASDCTSCEGNYQAVGSSCNPVCASNCASCTTPNTCTTCNSGYYANAAQTSCATCPSSCKTCTSATTCQTCNQGYYLSGSACTACATGCLSCTSSTECSACNEPVYTFNSENVCKPVCSNNCDSCTIPGFCDTCKTGYYKNSQNTCSACSSGCSACSSATVCSSCSSGYYLSGSQCKACSTGCTVCTSSTSCTECKSSTYILKGSVCEYQCNTPNCASCQGGVCSACDDGYYFSDGTCLSCQGSCKTCTGSTSCLTCISGYYFDSSSSKCFPCPSNCKACPDNQYCTECNDQYGLDNGVCVLFPSSCKSTQYYDVSSKQCQNCPTSCLRCSSATNCTRCAGSYFSNNGICTKCPSNCMTCSDASTCEQCYSTFTLENGACTRTCIEHCEDCSTGITCAKCEPSYLLFFHDCVPCPDNCNSCVAVNATDPLSLFDCTECSSEDYELVKTDAGTHCQKKGKLSSGGIAGVAIGTIGGAIILGAAGYFVVVKVLGIGVKKAVATSAAAATTA